jgi:hypothetical protein
MKFFCMVFFFSPLFLWSDRFTTELRGGYFLPASQVMREIYKNGGPEVEVEQIIRLDRSLNLWLNFNYFQREGHSVGLKDKTTIHLYPFSLGIKYNFHLLESFDLYFGLGGSTTSVRIHDHSAFVKKHIHERAFGGVGKFGFLYFIGKMVCIDLFADYYYTRISGVHRSGVQGTSRQVGGLRTGLGLGVRY